MKTDSFLHRKPWLKRSAVAALILFTLYLAFGVWGVPALLEWQLPKIAREQTGRAVTLERSTFNPLTWELRLYGLEVEGDADGPLLTLDRLAVNAQVKSLLPNRVELKWVEVDGVRAQLSLDEEGRLSIQDILDRVAAAAAPEDPEAKPMRARIQELRVHDAALAVVDRSIAAPYSESVVLERLVGRNVGTLPAFDRAELVEDAQVDEAYHWDFEGETAFGSGGQVRFSGGAWQIDPWGLRLAVEMESFSLASGQPYLSELVEARLGGLLDFQVEVSAELAEEGLPQVTGSGSAALRELSLEDDRRSYFNSEIFEIGAYSFDLAAGSVALRDTWLRGAALRVSRDESGEIELPRFIETTDEAGPAAADPNTDAPEMAALNVSLENVGIVGATLEIEDRSLQEPFRAQVADIGFTLEEGLVELGPEGIEAKGNANASVSVFGGQGSMQAELISLAEGAELELEWSGVELSPAQPYVSELANVTVESGSASGQLSVRYAPEGGVVANGQVALVELGVLDSVDASELAGLKAMALSGIHFSDEAGLRIESLSLTEPYANARMGEEGLNFAGLMKNSAPTEEVEPQETTETLEEAELESASAEGTVDFPVELQRFEISGGRFEFLDTTLVSRHRTRLSEVAVLVEGISLQPDQRADFDFAGKVDEGARIKVSGTLALADPKRFTEVDLDFSGYDMTAISPYWETYLGRGLAKGQFQLNSKYSVEESQMTGSNDFRIDQLTLGERVESEQAMNLPVGLAIGLLQGPDGAIDYDGLRVEGDLSDPQVSPWGLVGRALTNLVARAATAPFRFLAGMLGAREDLDTIAFETGEIELSEDGLAKAADLRRIFLERPALELQVSSQLDWDAEIDRMRRGLAVYRVLYPDRAVESGLSLLTALEEPDLADRIAVAYSRSLEDRAREESSLPSEAELDGPAESQSGVEPAERAGILRRVARFFGLGADRERSVNEASAATEVAGDAEPSEAQPQLAAEAEAPSLEEMLEAMAQEIPAEAIQEDWLRELGRERMGRLQRALLETGELQANRIFISDTVERSEAGAGSRLSLSVGE